MVSVMSNFSMLAPVEGSKRRNRDSKISNKGTNVHWEGDSLTAISFVPIINVHLD